MNLNVLLNNKKQNKRIGVKNKLQMFSKFKLKQAGRVDQHPNLQITKYHATNIQLSHSNSKWDSNTLDKVEGVIGSQDNFILLNSNKMAKQKQYNKYIAIKKNDSNQLLVHNALNQSLITFKKALKHDCFHDIILKNEVDKTVTVAFLPISTSDNIVPCGIQSFNKIHVNINLRGYKTFYITRLLFHKTMPVDEYNKWVIES